MRKGSEIKSENININTSTQYKNGYYCQLIVIYIESSEVTSVGFNLEGCLRDLSQERKFHISPHRTTCNLGAQIDI